LKVRWGKEFIKIAKYLNDKRRYLQEWKAIGSELLILRYPTTFGGQLSSMLREFLCVIQMKPTTRSIKLKRHNLKVSFMKRRLIVSIILSVDELNRRMKATV
jgi:hypothetical protein